MGKDVKEFGTRFLRDYSMLLAAVWGSDEELAKLLADPTLYAREKDLPVAAGSTVEVRRTPGDALPRKEDVIASWTGTPGIHVLQVPEASPFDLGELTDVELDSVAAGDNNINFFALL